MARVCLECKYYKPDGEYIGKCMVNSNYKRPNGICDNFTPKTEEGKKPDDLDVVEDLEQRVAKLERLVMKLL